jgi:hypothetical protein
LLALAHLLSDLLASLKELTEFELEIKKLEKQMGKYSKDLGIK